MPEVGNSKITAERIRELFSYNPETGDLIRLIYVQPRGFVGNVIKGSDLRVDGERHSISRYVWLHYYGEWPPLDKWIDHKDHNRMNNKIDNLRLASGAQNNQNRRGIINQHGCKGIEFRARRKPWTVRIWKNYKRIYIGAFATFEEAQDAYIKAAEEHHREFACVE